MSQKTIPGGTIQVKIEVGTVDLPHRFRHSTVYIYDELLLSELLDLYEEFRKKAMDIAERVC